MEVIMSEPSPSPRIADLEREMSQLQMTSTGAQARLSEIQAEILQLRGVPAVNPAWQPKLVIAAIDDGKWGCDPENARQVMLSAAGEMWKCFPERKMPRIDVTPRSLPPSNFIKVASSRFIF